MMQRRRRPDCSSSASRSSGSRTDGRRAVAHAVTRSAAPTAPTRSCSRCARSTSAAATRSSRRRSRSSPPRAPIHNVGATPVFVDIEPRHVQHRAATPSRRPSTAEDESRHPGRPVRPDGGDRSGSRGARRASRSSRTPRSPSARAGGSTASGVMAGESRDDRHASASSRRRTSAATATAG